jgi:hypothetical protein
MPPGAVAVVEVDGVLMVVSVADGAGIGSVVSAGVWAKAAPVISAAAPAAMRSVFIGEGPL